jgi:DNA-binding transcriptional LysR family regulator
MESFNDVCARNQQGDSFTYCLREGTVLDVVDDVAGQESDLGVIHYTNQLSDRIRDLLTEKRLTLRPIVTLKPHIVLSKNHELIRQGRPVTLENLADYGFVRYSGQYEDFIYQVSTRTGQWDLSSSAKIAYVYGRAALLHLISISDFYTIGISGFLTQDSMYQILSKPIPDSTEQLEFAVITRQDEPLSDTEEEFVEDVIERYHKVQELEQLEL